MENRALSIYDYVPSLSRMKAIRIHEYGNASTLRYEEAPKPELTANDVRVRVRAAGVNPVDWKIREGYLKEMIPYPMPLVLGWDVSGEVEEVGSDVSDFKVGDEVYSRPDIARDGSYAEFVTVRASELALKPKSLSHAEAASVPLAALTAWQGLFTIAKLEAGQTVLIHGASGGVGSFAVQMAKNAGAKVIGTGSARSKAHLLELGADVVVDYNTEKFEDHAKDVDVVFDLVGGETQTRSFATLKAGGILVSVTDTPSEELAAKHGVRSAFLFVQPDAKALTEIAKLFDAGTLKTHVSERFPLAEAAEAHNRSQSGKAHGKIVLEVN
jgi:NADPH:quinone reductase-like Zn-dependent oxidoreductase